MEPAATIIAMFGGVGKVAKLVGRHRTRVNNWKRSRERGGTGGEIPNAVRDIILAAATEQGLPIDRKMIDGAKLPRRRASINLAGESSTASPAD